MNKILSPTIRTVVTAALLGGASLAAAEPVTYKIDPDHTDIVASSRHFGTSTTRSRFAGKSGEITIDPVAKTGKATIVIDMTSITSGVPKLDEHLKSNAFFDVASYPEATLVATDFQFDGDKIAQVSGQLTMHGKTNPITLVSTNYNCYTSPAFKKQVCGGDFEGTIQRSLWDVKYGIPIVSDETKLAIQIEAVKN